MKSYFKFRYSIVAKLGFFLMVFCSNASALTEKKIVTNSSNVTQFIIYSSNHGDPRIANIAKLWLPGLEGGCTGLYYFADKEIYLHTMVLPGLRKPNQPIVIYYHIDESVKMPGGSSTCQLVAFQYLGN